MSTTAVAATDEFTQKTIVGSIVSTCCKAFTIDEQITLRCSKCGKNFGRLQTGNEIKIGTFYNVIETKEEGIGVSRDIINGFLQKMKRCYNDPTLELVNVHCRTCDEKFTRFFRDPKGEGYFICKNKHIHKN